MGFLGLTLWASFYGLPRELRRDLLGVVQRKAEKGNPIDSPTLMESLNVEQRKYTRFNGREMMPNGDSITIRVDAIKQLLEAFKYERIVYLMVTIVSLCILLVCAIFLLSKGEVNAVIGLLCSSGGIIYSAGRVLKMWSDALKVISPSIKGDEQ